MESLELSSLGMDSGTEHFDGRKPVLMSQYAAHEINVVMWAALLIVTWILMRRLLSVGVLWMKAGRLPGPPAYHFPKHANAENYTEYFRALHQKYGPVVRVWLGPARVLISLKDRNLAQEMLLQAEDRERKICRAFELAFGRGSLTTASSGQAKWRRLNLYNQFSGKLLNSVHRTAVKVAGQVERWARPCEAGLKVDFKEVSRHMSFASQGLMLFGESFLLWPAAEEFESLVMDVSGQILFWAKFNALPIWNQNFRRYRKLCHRLQTLVEEIMCLSRQHRQGWEKDGDRLFCYLDHVDSVVDSERNKKWAKGLVWGVVNAAAAPGAAITADEVKGHIMAVLYHGFMTVSNVMGGLLVRLAKDSDVQAKVWAEVQRVCKGRTPTAADVSNMDYFQAVLYESSRLVAGSQFVSRCSLDRDLQVGDVVLPAGALLSIPVELLQTDVEECGPDACEFHPERFLKNLPLQRRFHYEPDMESSVLLSDKWISESGHPSGQQAVTPSESDSLVFCHPDSSTLYLTFGLGPRACVGQKAATLQMLTIVSCILQRYELEADMEESPTLQFNTPRLGLILVSRH